MPKNKNDVHGTLLWCNSDIWEVWRYRFSRLLPMWPCTTTMCMYYGKLHAQSTRLHVLNNRLSFTWFFVRKMFCLWFGKMRKIISIGHKTFQKKMINGESKVCDSWIFSFIQSEAKNPNKHDILFFASYERVTCRKIVNVRVQKLNHKRYKTIV